MKYFYTAVFFFSFLQTSFAQYEPQFSHYAFNRMLLNPAHAGAMEGLEANLVYRAQYVNIAEKLISSQHAAVNMPLEAIHSGIGLSIVNDFIGYYRSTYINLAYDYRKKFRFGTLSAGIGLGLINTAINGKKLTTPDGDYVNGINHNDPLVPDNIQTGNSADISAGLYLSGERYYCSVAANHLYSTAKFSTFKMNIARNILFSGGYNFKTTKNLEIFPTILLKTDFNKVQLDASVF